MDALRIEKGYIGVGAEADGRTSPLDLGLPSGIKRTDKFIGRDGLKRLHERDGARLELVGLLAEDASFPLNEGAQLINQADERGFGTIVGHVTSAAFCPTMQRSIALALLRNGRNRIDGNVNVTDPMRGARTSGSARVTLPLFYDPGHKRLRG
jgi:sarcosine oxidase subunit alpha